MTIRDLLGVCSKKPEMYLTGLPGLGLVFLALTMNSWAGAFVGLAAGPTFIVGNRARSVAIGDFNGDGLPDIAVAGYGSSQVNLFLSCTSGTTNCTNGFLPGVHFSVGAPIAIVAADVNGDGKLDLLVSTNGTNRLSLFLGHGDGTFSLSRCNGAGSLCSTGGGPTALAVGNFKGQPKEVDLV